MNRGRPKLTDPDVRINAAASCLKQLIEQVPDPFAAMTVDDLAVMRHDLSQCLDRRDGYRIGKYLDDVGWFVDAAVVAVLDGDYLFSTHFGALAQWVIDHKIEPKLSDHTLVQAQILTRAGHYTDVEGVILSANRERAEYIVHTPDQAEGTGFSVPYELVVAVEGRIA